jgi:aarF domain-containing kinase
MRPRPISLFRLQRRLQTSAPRHPRSAPSSSPPQAKRRGRWRAAAVLALAGGGVYLFDRECNASALSRSLRTGYIG